MRILLFQLWAAIGFSKPSKSTDQFSNIDKFILCDLNRDQRIDKQEFQDCTTFPSLTNHQQAIEEIYTHFDVDHDSHLSKHEFSLYFNVLTDHERKVEIITADGKKKTVTQGEFLKMEEEKRKGFKYENGQVSKVNEGSLNLDQIKEENPDLSRFITLGQWAHHQITRLGYATGNIAGLKSIDDFDQRGESFRDNYLEMKFEITIKESSKTTQNVTFEVSVVWDPANYLPPHLVMTSLTKLRRQKDGEILERTPLTCPESKRRQWPFTLLYYLAKHLSENTVPIVIVSGASLIILALLHVFVSSSSSEEELIKKKE